MPNTSNRLRSFLALLNLTLALGVLTACTPPLSNNNGGTGGSGGGPPYTVTYTSTEATGGTAPTDSTQYADGDTVTVLGQGTLTWPHWTFRGWSTTTHNETASPTYAVGATFVIHSNVTLYDSWTYP